MSNHPIESFDSLLRNLLAYDLVEQNDDRWVLRPFAARRLSELADSAPQHARVSVYIGYLCERCHAAGITRAFEGQRLCDACIQTLRQPDGVPRANRAETPPPVRTQRGARLVARYRTTGARGNPSEPSEGPVHWGQHGRRERGGRGRR